MGLIKPVHIIFCGCFTFSVLFVSLKAQDPLCAGLPVDEVVPFPHETNCSLYYECLNGVKTTQMCDNDLYYNPTIQACDFPEASGCINKDPQCYGVNLDYLPHPSDCDKYIECYEGNSYEMECPTGYWFHAGQKMCVDPQESDCVTTTTTPWWTTPHPICWGVRPGEVVLKRYEGDCRKYWQCEGAQLTEETCPWNYYFDEARQLCDFPDLVDCDQTTGSPDPTETPPQPPTTPSYDDIDPRCINNDLDYWFHPVSCEKYIECYHGFSYEMDCPNGFYFSELKKKCVPPSESECGKTDPPPISSTEFPTDWTSDPDCPYPESEGKLLPYPGDCTRYYECNFGQKVEMPCPPDLWFNQDIMECDYPYQSNCPYRKLSVLDLIRKYIRY